ncbi:MAG: hypothetical protein HRU31_16525 [Rhodobacteraceae bacterium]|nr:hypothetical protein [Paracoccaceae bacterium]
MAALVLARAMRVMPKIGTMMVTGMTGTTAIRVAMMTDPGHGRRVL